MDRRNDHDDELKKIMDEVDDFDMIDDTDANIDDILKEDIEKANYSPTKIQKIEEYKKEEQKEIQKNKKAVAMKPTDHPLEFLENQERDISLRLGGQIDLDSKFILSNSKITQEAKHASLSYTTLEVINKYCYPAEGSMVPAHGDFSGNPKCTAVLPRKYIAIGTSRGVVLLFDYGLTNVEKIGTSKEAEYGAVTSIDFTPNGDLMVSGYDSGHIVLWSFEKKQKMIKTVSPKDEHPVLCVKFWKGDSNDMIVSLGSGAVYLYRFNYSFFKWRCDATKLLDPESEKKKEHAEHLEKYPNGYHSIQILKKEHCRGHPLAQYTVVALASMKMILVVTLEPHVGIVYKFERPPELVFTSVSCISWGIGSVPGDVNNKHPLLAIGWGNEIQLLQFQNLEEESTRGIRFVGFHETEEEIFNVDFISENLLHLYDFKRNMRLLYTGYFQPATFYEKDNLEFDKAEMSQHVIDPDIAFLSSYKDVEKRTEPAFYYGNTMMSIDSLRRCFILGSKRMYVGKLYGWREYIEELIEKADWLTALSLIISMYQGNTKMFAELPNSQKERTVVLRSFGGEIIKDYIISISKIHGSPDQDSVQSIWKTAVFTVIDFLVSLENFNFLFIDMRKWFADFGLKDLFLSSLEPFILRNRVKLIPNDPFREVINYFTEREKMDVLQYLMINLSLKDIDFDYTITLCMDKNLLTAIYYLFTHREDDPDFITPISRALAIFRTKKEELNEAAAYPFGLKFLWFLAMTLKGRMFPADVIPDNIWKSKVQDILTLLFEEQVLRVVININPHISFEILKLFFEPKLASVIETFKEKQVALMGNLMGDEKKTKGADVSMELKMTVFDFQEAIKNRIQAQMLALIYHCSVGEKKSENLMRYMLANLTVHLNYKIPLKVVEDTVTYILKNKRDIPAWEVTRKKLEEKDEFEEGDFAIEERSVLVVGLLNAMKTKLTNTKIDRYLNYAEEFVDVKVFLSQFQKNYKKCFEYYMQQGSNYQRRKIFKWLYELIPEIKEKDKANFRIIKDTVLDRLRDLVQIDSEMTRRIVLGLDRELEADAVKKLDNFPKLQLEYLKNILAQRHQGVKIQDDLLVLHLKLLCDLHPDLVVKEIKTHNYPLDECLRICKEKEIQEGIAFFNERAGNVKEALKILIDLFKGNLEKEIRRIEKDGQFIEQNLKEKINSAREVCMKHNKIGDPDSELMWFELLDKILHSHYEFIANNKSIDHALNNKERSPQLDAYRKLNESYSNFIKELFEDLCKHVQVESIMAKLQDYRTLKLGDLKHSLIGMLDTYLYESNILKDAKTLIVGDTYESLAELYNRTSNGMRSDRNELDADIVDKMVIFSCGHAFPRNYVHGNLCAICSDSEILKAKSILNSMKKGGPVAKAKPTSSKDSDQRVSLLQDRNRITKAVDEGTYMKSTKSEAQERYLRKMMIFDDKKKEETSDLDEFSQYDLF